MTRLSSVATPLETTSCSRMEKIDFDKCRGSMPLSRTGSCNPKPSRKGGQANSIRCRSSDRSVKSRESARSSPTVSGSSSCLSASSSLRRGGVRRNHSSDDCLVRRDGPSAEGFSQKRYDGPSDRQQHQLPSTSVEDDAVEKKSQHRDGGRRRRASTQEEDRKLQPAHSSTSAMSPPETEVLLDTSMVLNASLSSSLASSNPAKVKTEFDVDAPRPKPLLMRKGSSVDSTLHPRNSSATFSELTEEQRAWAGIDELLSGDDNASIATRDVLPDEIVRAMSSDLSVVSQSVPTEGSTRRRRTQLSSFRAPSKRNAENHRNEPPQESSHSNTAGKSSSSGTRKSRTGGTMKSVEQTRAQDVRQEADSLAEGRGDHGYSDTEKHATSPMQHMMPGCAQYEAGAPPIPALLDASFSSLQSNKSKQSIATITTNNYVVQSSHGAAAQTNFQMVGMQQFMAQLCVERQTQPGHSHPQSHSAMGSTGVTSTLFSSCSTHGNPRHSGSKPMGFVADPLCAQGGCDYGARNDQKHEENSEDEEDCEDDDHSRVLIQKYTQASFNRNGSHSKAGAHRRPKLPELMDSSFSSVQTEMSGILSLISSAKNYVVQADDINPMGVFLGNITRNLERKRIASNEFDCEEDRIQYMYELDEIADERRKILEEEIELYQNGGYDDEFYDGCGNMNELESSQFHFEPDEDDGVEAVSMPSLTSLKESDVSPLPSPLSTASAAGPRQVSKQALVNDWRAWVDSAFLQAQAQAEVQAQTQRLQTTRAHDFQAEMGFPENSLFESQDSSPSPLPARHSPNQKAPNMRKRKPRTPLASKTKGGSACSDSAPAAEPVTHHLDHTQVPLKDEEVISLSKLCVPASSVVLSPSELPSVLPAQLSHPRSPSRFHLKKKDKFYHQHVREHRSPLVSLRNKMSRLYKFGVKGRRGSPASVLDGGRGDEARFFPTIDEEEEEDWGTLLPN